ncbi:MAG TPA: YncE family protein [Candidatus Dormibacteraeota bacterium]|nr:YncE family protein [Candidatus Dormibacteraeota bacterium]
MSRKSRLLATAIILSLTALAFAAAAPGYHVVATWKVGGEGGWDYLTADASARRLYISRGTHVMVLDLDSGKSVGDIPDTPGVHGIALAPDLGRGFTSNGRENTVTIFDIQTLKPIGDKVKVGETPDAILYDSASKRVFTFNARGKDSTAIDATSGKVLGTIPLGGKPEFAASDAKGEIFVNNEDTSELIAIDPNKLEVKSKWPLAPCKEPSGLSIDRKNRRLFVGCDNKMMAVVDADSGKVLATPAIGEGVDATAFDDETGLAFASCGEGVLTVVKEESPAKFNVAESVPTQQRARTMALDSKTHNAYVVTAKFGPQPAPTTDNPHPRPPMLPDSFVVLVLGK